MFTSIKTAPQYHSKNVTFTKLSLSLKIYSLVKHELVSRISSLKFQIIQAIKDNLCGYSIQIVPQYHSNK